MFQSQFYFFGFSILAIWLAAPAPAFALRWLGAALAIIFSYFSMAYGALTAAAVVALTLLQFVAGVRKLSVRKLLGVVAMVLAFVFMFRAHPSYSTARCVCRAFGVAFCRGIRCSGGLAITAEYSVRRDS